MNILETFEFRGHFPGIGNLLNAVNRLLETGEYTLKLPLDPINPRLLHICIHGSKSSRPTLDLKLPLAEDISEIRIFRLTDFFSSKKSRSKDCNPIYFSSDDKSISFIIGQCSDTFVPFISSVDDGKIVHEHTFELRKVAPGISDVLSAISGLLNEHQYVGTATMDGNTHRWLQLQIFYQHQMQATLVFSRRLKTVRKEDIMELTKLNFAWAYHAPVEFHSDDDENIHVIVSEPENVEQLRRLLASYSILK